MNNQTLIHLADIKREYTNEEVTTPALRGINLDIEQGSFVAIMGPSGSGKSTLMHILGFLDRPSSGTYEFKNKDITQLSEPELAHLRGDEVGFVFQSFNLLQKSTVLENILLPTIYTKITARERFERADKAIGAVSMEHRAKHYSNQLSGGERQRVAIARALVNNPSIIFADEPTGNLDTKNGEMILNLLVKLHEKGNTIVMVTHELEAAEHAGRIIRMRDGLIESDRINQSQRRNGFSK